MASCREIEPLLPPYVDDEATGSQRAAVDEHLQHCGPCRTRAASEAAGRLILKTGAERMRAEAPPSLRARCHSQRMTPRSRWLAVRPVRAWAIAAMLLLVVFGAGLVTTGSTRVLAAELALDHLKCFALFERVSAQSNPSALEQHLHASYGWTLKVPPTCLPLKLRLVGGRRCFSTDGRVAHILYRHDGRPLSLFVMPGAARRPESLATVGHEAIVWSQRGMTYAIVAREPRTDLAAVAAYVKQAMQ